ncbi:unnamed protein product [Rotaria sp. Silwood1]|nr:unnamed protein product [Rotaria sp. Silwood1]
MIYHQSQKHKQLYKSINHNENSSIVKYNYLITVDISKVHDNYKEEFLFNTKTYFHTNILLYIRDDTRLNYVKINKIYLFEGKSYSKFL